MQDNYPAVSHQIISKNGGDEKLGRLGFLAELGEGDAFELAEAFGGEVERAAEVFEAGDGVAGFVGGAVVGGGGGSLANGRAGEKFGDLFVIGEAIGDAGEADVVDVGDQRNVAAALAGGDAAGEFFHEGQGGVGAEAVAAVDVEGVGGAHESDVAVGDEVHERTGGAAGGEVLAGHADDEGEIAGNDAAARGGHVTKVRLQASEVTPAGFVGVEFAAKRDELELVKVQLEKQAALLGGGEERGAVEGGDVGGKIAREAAVFDAGVGFQAGDGGESFDDGSGGGLVVEGVVDKFDFGGVELIEAVFQ